MFKWCKMLISMRLMMLETLTWLPIYTEEEMGGKIKTQPGDTTVYDRHIYRQQRICLFDCKGEMEYSKLLKGELFLFCFKKVDNFRNCLCHLNVLECVSAQKFNMKFWHLSPVKNQQHMNKCGHRDERTVNEMDFMPLIKI